MELKEAIAELKTKTFPCFEMIIWKGNSKHSEILKQVEALQTAISHLENLEKVKEAGGVKRKEIYENNYSNGWNDCLDAVHAELTGKLEELKTVIDLWLKSSYGIEKLKQAIQDLFLGKKEE